MRDYENLLIKYGRQEFIDNVIFLFSTGAIDSEQFFKIIEKEYNNIQKIRQHEKYIRQKGKKK